MREQKEMIIAMGSNTDTKKHLDEAANMLTSIFKEIKFTQRIVTKAIGIKSKRRFVNCLAYTKTPYGYTQIFRALKQIESKIGCRGAKSKGIVMIDLDIIMYNGERFHEQDWERDYIHKLMGQVTWT